MACNFTMKKCLMLILALPFMANAAELIDVRYTDVANKRVKLEFVFDENINASSTDFSIEPAQLVVKFPGASNALELNTFPDNAAGIISITPKNINDALNLTIALEEVVKYEHSITGGNYTLILGKNTPATIAPVEATAAIATKAEPTPTPLAEQQTEAPDSSYINKIDSLDFRLNEAKAGQLRITFNNESLAANVKQNGSRIEIDLLGSEISEADLYTMDVVDFATPVRSFETFRDGEGAKVIIETMKPFSFEHEQIGSELILTVKEPPKKVTRPSERVKKVVYKGKVMTLNFQSVAVRTALQIIADFNNFNLVTGDSVDGDVTLRLEDVPWDQALDMILKMQGLDKRIEGNILLVAPAEELALREAAELKANQDVEQLVPVYSEYIQINYAKARDVALLLDGGESQLLSERGSVAVDERTNTLLVQDTAKKLDDVRRLIEVVDVAVKQVVIEARIVTVSDNVNEEFGIRWGVTDTFSDGASSGNLTGAGNAGGGVIPSLSDRLNVNLPVAEPAGTIAFQIAKLADGLILDLELSALERENKSEIIARPSITTANQKPAFIEQGTEIPYVSAASSGATTVTFKPAVLSLRVTPHITPDGRVILDLLITQDARGDTVKTAIGEAVAINTQKIGTQVLVNNGQTVVLGGIYQQQLINAVTKVPVLGDVPLLGWLFRTQKEFTERRELLIFVTPRILNDVKS
ncbi:type IV pilus secretin PilQ [Psychrobium sp. 1_MG-2023]|uniref:type IV pilus secretin PilQ n=1 Tax=Psychrobium sp. 1_MG-2023 TaxID=3062624 RepID=UPI00273633E3|nr:type IV pilus secretin PilQ family protein [Psychrobium sp. 1_MG-2023]MDP2560995.1 type IV pilus secretin PilQ family protein [Psychrobium sp. 1_MG-2023]